MPPKGLRSVQVTRRATLLLLVLTSLLLLGLTLTLTGRTYKKVDPVPLRNLKTLVERLDQGAVPTDVVVALAMPMILNTLIFLPWGFLMFVVLDQKERPAWQSYLFTIVLAIGFSSLIEGWQYFLPTRVTDIDDVIWNGVGALLGAVLGHLRKRVRFEFE